MKTPRFVPSILRLWSVAALATAAQAQLSWTELQPPTSPAPRFGHSIEIALMSYEPILFGGFDGANAFGDTWSWNGQTWILRASSGPSPRYDHTLGMLDFQDDSLLLFGGRDAAGTLNGETWIWNGTSWSPLATPTAPSPRAGHAMAVDQYTVRTLLLFGGRTDAGLSDETWLFSNDHWVPVPTATRPPAREGHALINVADVGTFLLSGGRNGSTIFSDEWEFDGTDWRSVPASGAVARADHDLVFESMHRRRILTFGGNDGSLQADTAERAAQGTWIRHDTVGEPSARESSAIAVTNSFVEPHYVLFGGRDEGGAALGDTWRLRPMLMAATEPFGTGTGPGPWGDGGPLLHSFFQPLLGSQLTLYVMTRSPITRLVVLIGGEARNNPFARRSLLVEPTQYIYARTKELAPGAQIGFAEVQHTIPFDTQLRGTQVCLQVVAGEPLALNGLAYSRGLRFTLAD